MGRNGQRGPDGPGLVKCSNPIASRRPKLRYCGFGRVGGTAVPHPSCSRHARPRGRGRFCVTARGRELRGGRLSSSVGAGHRCVRARWRAVACQSGHSWTCDGFGVQFPPGSPRRPCSAASPTRRPIRFAPDGRVFVAEKSGLIKVFDVAHRHDPDRRRRPADAASTTTGTVASSG